MPDMGSTVAAKRNLFHPPPIYWLQSLCEARVIGCKVFTHKKTILAKSQKVNLAPVSPPLQGGGGGVDYRNGPAVFLVALQQH